jgi:hypothetical protein
MYGFSKLQRRFYEQEKLKEELFIREREGIRDTGKE